MTAVKKVASEPHPAQPRSDGFGPAYPDVYRQQPERSLRDQAERALQHAKSLQHFSLEVRTAALLEASCLASLALCDELSRQRGSQVDLGPR